MVTQSRVHPVPLLLTRPVAQGVDFANRLKARFGDQLNIIHTPLLAPRFLAPDMPAGPFSGLILTSQTGVDGYLRLGDATHALPKDVFCVGNRTANAARTAQLRPVLVAEDAASLILQIKDLRPSGRLLHLRGREARGNISFLLDIAGIDTVEAVIYAQEQRTLTAEAHNSLVKPNPILLPLFSPRSAQIFGLEMVRVGGISPLFVACMSAAIALEATKFAAQVLVATKPDAAALLDAVASLLQDMQRA